MVKFTKDKAWIKLESDLVHGFIPTTKLESVIENATPVPEPVDLTLKVRKIRKEQFNEILGTLRVFHDIEAAFLMYYSPKLDEWLIHCPEHVATGASVRFKTDPVFEENLVKEGGFYRVGTIHTHPGMRAFWSGTDMSDQIGTPGLHIVLGLNKQGFVIDYKATVFTSYGHRDIPLENVVDELELDKDHEVCNEFASTLHTAYLSYLQGNKQYFVNLEDAGIKPVRNTYTYVPPAPMQPLTKVASATIKRYGRGSDRAILRMAAIYAYGYDPEEGGYYI